MNKGILIAALVVIIAVAGYFIFRDKPSEIATVFEPVAVDTTDWVTYESAAGGFSLRHPKDWKVNDQSVGGYRGAEIGSPNRGDVGANARYFVSFEFKDGELEVRNNGYYKPSPGMQSFDPVMTDVRVLEGTEDYEIAKKVIESIEKI